MSVGDDNVSDTVRMQVGWIDAPREPESLGVATPSAPRVSALRALVRFLTFRRIAPDDLPRTDGALVAVAAAPLLLWLIYDRWSAGAEAWWFGSGLGGLAWNLVAIALVSWVVGRISAPPQSLRTMLWFASALMLIVVPAQAALLQWGTYPLIVWMPLLLGAVCLALLGRGLSGLGVRRVFVPLAVAMLGILGHHVIAERSFLSAGMWFAAGNDGASEDYGARQDDRWLLEQPERVDAALAALAPRDPSRANVYFLGVAGYGEEKVFAEEIALAERVVGKRYGSTQRSIALVNDRRDIETRPAATVWSLERALRGIAERMDVERDVLFLALSSHGAEDGEFALTSGGLMLEQLTPELLRKALDAAGIRWRVIVVSACYSGKFVPALQSPDTIVLTAAAADRTSFGCSDQRDVTWFGEAFYRDALPRALSLTEAFDTARQVIARREKADGLDASRPASHVGAEIGRYWMEAIESNAYRVSL
jgi:hypothetical protein